MGISYDESQSPSGTQQTGPSPSSFTFTNILPRFGWDFFCCLILIACSLKFTSDIETKMDVRPADESNYMFSGINLYKTGLSGPEWSPAYQVWYFVLSRFAEDPIDVYYLNYRLLCLFLPLAMFGAMRALRVHSVIALMICVALLNSYAFYVWPYPAHFAALVALCVVAVASLLRPLYGQLIGLTLGFQLVSLCRPEYFLSFLAAAAVSGLYGVWVLWRNRSPRFPVAVAYAVAILISVGGVLFMGNPLKGRPNAVGYSRSFIAFGQHYAVRKVEDSRENISPWHQWEKIVARDFGTASSIVQCVRVNPKAMAEHLCSNIIGSIGAWFDITRPNGSTASKFVTGMIAAVLLLTTLSAVFRRSTRMLPREASSNEVPSLKPPTHVAWLAVVFSLVGVSVSVLLVYPRHHYILPISLIATVAIVATLHRWLVGRNRVSKTVDRQRMLPVIGTCVALSAFVFLTPQRGAGYRAVNQWESGLAFTNTVRQIRRLPNDKNYKLIDMIGMDSYLGENFSEPDATKIKSLRELLSEEGVHIFINDVIICRDVPLAEDPDFKLFLSDPASFGYESLVVTGAPWKVFLPLAQAKQMQNHH